MPEFKIKKSYIPAFTLAEVLITLAIIGIVSVLTVTNLIKHYNEQETLVELKKFYTMLTQAYTLCLIENGSPETWLYETWNGGKAQIVINKLIPYMKIDKKCATPGSNCYRNITYKYLDGSDRGKIDTYSNWVSTKLADGMFIIVAGDTIDVTCSQTSGNIKNICGHIIVDVNGGRKPNQYGHDVHHFYFTSKSIVPMGHSSEEIKPCSNKYNSCPDWIFQNGNMDYLHCNDLSWTEKRKCSN